MKKNQIPFCPNCGQQKNVEPLSEYLKSWKCINCNIRFDFSKLDPNFKNRMNPENSILRTVLDPARKVTIYENILDPARKIKIELLKDELKITGDENALTGLFNASKLAKDFNLATDKQAKIKKSSTDFKSGSFGNIEE